jgi:hypothetical protein
MTADRDNFEGYGYDGQEIGCTNCDGGWRHRCWDDMCISRYSAEDCRVAVCCRDCNPLADYQ